MIQSGLHLPLTKAPTSSLEDKITSVAQKLNILLFCKSAYWEAFFMSIFKGIGNQGLLHAKRLSFYDNKYTAFLLKNEDTEWYTKENNPKIPQMLVFYS